MLKRTDKSYFEYAYRGNADVFGDSDSWYERRKRAILLATLSIFHYGSVFEPGGGIGALTMELAPRCDHLLMMDWSTTALQHAARRLTSCRNVELAQGAVPEAWPRSQSFDLIVFSELLYYLTEVEILTIAQLACNSLRPFGEIALLHWRHASADYPTTGAHAHRLFLTASNAANHVVHEDRDFVLHVIAKPIVTLALKP